MLSGGVTVKDGACVSGSVIMDDVVIEEGASVYYAIVDSDTVIKKHATVGTMNADKDNITVIAKGSVITENTKTVSRR